ncbi:hypothetical protein SISSUDRAFT_420070 [Sistotremastrum suecicum HHB10207 ss-3]|uniref:Uncharacterized protein n=1 Tax=Sistotremastrum suecicum HHB10207 ss-3 TaxID=1314776 RepID=A0A165YKQ9_9AGAM|nr:hypothetical protein SISSUDRAFT_420070 [Sistotremastrum suecicum HHB10207 ss-3]
MTTLIALLPEWIPRKMHDMQTLKNALLQASGPGPGPSTVLFSMIPVGIVGSLRGFICLISLVLKIGEARLCCAGTTTSPLRIKMRRSSCQH